MAKKKFVLTSKNLSYLIISAVVFAIIATLATLVEVYLVATYKWDVSVDSLLIIPAATVFIGIAITASKLKSHS